ncbi:rho GTPase-activating protein 33-like [Sapajus apella]|uniref:Rho GTPase-activating protein 33-like n=1 Tax=Sapajus apella TaxID=9515 RepID=A0A6J3HSF8_SAPAP|nr:rho GTPase-activating protein 33-like [Sapajus apella]
MVVLPEAGPHCCTPSWATFALPDAEQSWLAIVVIKSNGSRSAPQHTARRPTQPEPLYVNLALGPRGPSPASSSSSSPPPAHPRSRSDPGPPVPRLPQKQRAPWGSRTPHRVPSPWGPPSLSCSTGQPHRPTGRGVSSTEGPCTEMEDKEGRGLDPHPPTPLPAGPSTLRARPEATAERQLGGGRPCFPSSSLDLGPDKSLVLYFLEP